MTSSPRTYRRGRLGRLLCRLGLHRMQWVCVVDRIVDEDAGEDEVQVEVLRVCDYGWCADPDCRAGRATLYNVEYRRF